MDDDDLDPEGPGPADLHATQCPGCRRFVDADAQRCPGCGDWMSDEVPMRSNPLWVVLLLALLVFAAFAGWVL